MIRLVDITVQKCIKDGYISKEKAPWLRYFLEKKVSGIVVSIPFLLFGILISDPAAAIAFYLGFCFLRERTNGMHAETVLGCFLLSLLFEFLFLGIMFWQLSLHVINLLTTISSAVILLFAPFNHPYLGLTQEDLKICSQKAKCRLLVLLLIIFLAYLNGQYDVVSGLGLSIALTAVLLVFAYIFKPGGKKHEFK